MNSIAQFSATDFYQAALVSKLSGRPARVVDDVYAWNGHVIDRATAIVVLLKANNGVPVSDSVKLRLYKTYKQKFSNFNESWLNIEADDESVAARIWFSRVHKDTHNRNDVCTNAEIKNILIELHQK